MVSHRLSFSGSGSARVNAEHVAGKNSSNISRNGDSQDGDHRPTLSDSCTGGFAARGFTHSCMLLLGHP